MLGFALQTLGGRFVRFVGGFVGVCESGGGRGAWGFGFV